jgi:hypothetical protein
MSYQIIVTFGKEKDYEFKLNSGDLTGHTQEAARRWFDKEFSELECDIASPTGKILIIDKILSVAKYGGEQRFADRKEWANAFARSAAMVLGRDLIKVDVPAFTLGY